MFIGEFRHNLDQKGRLAIPVRYRGRLAEGCVATRGVDQCLTVYPIEVWDKMAKKLATLPVSQKEARSFVRLMLSGAMLLELDKQGRMTLPDFLRKYAHLRKKSVIVGLYDHLEIWDETEWTKFREKTEKESATLAEKLKELGV